MPETTAFCHSIQLLRTYSGEKSGLAFHRSTVHNVEMKTVARIFLAIVLIGCLTLAGFLLHGPKEKETWSTLTGLLAVTGSVKRAAYRSMAAFCSDNETPSPCLAVETRM